MLHFPQSPVLKIRRRIKLANHECRDKDKKYCGMLSNTCKGKAGPRGFTDPSAHPLPSDQGVGGLEDSGE
jgi:hypothetical protein